MKFGQVRAEVTSWHPVYFPRQTPKKCEYLDNILLNQGVNTHKQGLIFSSIRKQFDKIQVTWYQGSPG